MEVTGRVQAFAARAKRTTPAQTPAFHFWCGDTPFEVVMEAPASIASAIASAAVSSYAYGTILTVYAVDLASSGSWRVSFVKTEHGAVEAIEATEDPCEETLEDLKRATGPVHSFHASGGGEKSDLFQFNVCDTTFRIEEGANPIVYAAMSETIIASFDTGFPVYVESGGMSAPDVWIAHIVMAKQHT